MRRKGRVNKTWRLFHVDLFGKDSIKEDIMYIELMNLPTMPNHNGQNQPDNCLLNDKTKGFRIINAFLLSKTFSN
jgi:hypothetical protein